MGMFVSLGSSLIILAVMFSVLVSGKDKAISCQDEDKDTCPAYCKCYAELGGAGKLVADKIVNVTSGCLDQVKIEFPDWLKTFAFHLIRSMVEMPEVNDAVEQDISGCLVEKGYRNQTFPPCECKEMMRRIKRSDSNEDTATSSKEISGKMQNDTMMGPFENLKNMLSDMADDKEGGEMEGFEKMMASFGDDIGGKLVQLKDCIAAHGEEILGSHLEATESCVRKNCEFNEKVFEDTRACTLSSFNAMKEKVMAMQNMTMISR